MFSYTVTHWSAFLTAAFLLNIAPGPDMLFILGQTVRGGKRAGFVAMFGIWTGAFVHVLCAALGLSAILTTSARAFGVVKWAGAAYLVWIGVQALRSHGSIACIQVAQNPRRLSSILRQGVLVAALNPKVALFFLAFLPQFVEPGAGPAWAQFFLHGSLIVGMAVFVEPPLILLGSRVTVLLGSKPALARWMDRVLGGFFVALGLKLAATD